VLNGLARAGGIGLVAACDLAIAPDTATFAFTEVRIGVIPAIISVPCLQRMTPRAVARYFLTGEVFDATAAVDCGLLTAAAPAADVPALADALASAVALGAPDALAATKRLLREVPAMATEVAFDYAERISEVFFTSEDAAEGRAAFADKRPPRWAT
jgi:methylglutaconyl-CoA hydratase